MTSNVTTTSPTIEIKGDDAEPSDAAISALARLLLAVADQDDPPQETAIAANHATGAATAKPHQATNAQYHIDD